jgi:hypothetical protein
MPFLENAPVTATPAVVHRNAGHHMHVAAGEKSWRKTLNNMIIKTVAAKNPNTIKL